MMEQDWSKEIETLKAQMENLQKSLPPQLDELRSMVMSLLPNKPAAEPLSRIHVMHGMHPDPRLSEQMEELCRKTEEQGVSGLVTYLGVFSEGGRQSNWIRNSVPVDGLLTLIDRGMADKVLACIGNANRLALLLEILHGPKTVAELVERCGFGSTGQVYHHLRPLLAADIVAEDEKQKGAYVIRPHRVQGLVMLLAGISDLVDETYTQGNWDAAGAD